MSVLHGLANNALRISELLRGNCARLAIGSASFYFLLGANEAGKVTRNRGTSLSYRLCNIICLLKEDENDDKFIFTNIIA